jgi:hypothetical protein
MLEVLPLESIIEMLLEEYMESVYIEATEPLSVLIMIELRHHLVVYKDVALADQSETSAVQ